MRVRGNSPILKITFLLKIVKCQDVPPHAEVYFEPALKKARECSFGTSGKEVVIEVSKLADEIGVIGAASLPLG